MGAPAEEDAQVGIGVQPGPAAVAAKVGGHCGAQDELVRTRGNGTGSRSREGHELRCVTMDGGRSTHGAA
jgi:hypothetical protein